MENTSVNRVYKFFDESDFKLHNDIAKEFIEDFFGITLFLRKIDRKNTVVDSLYNEVVSSIVLLPEIKISVSDFILEEGEQKQYDTKNANINYQNYGNIEFTVQKSFLDERNLVIDIGDIVIFKPNENQNLYFEIMTDFRAETNTKNLLLGIKPSFKKFKAINIDNSKLNL